MKQHSTNYFIGIIFMTNQQPPLVLFQMGYFMPLVGFLQFGHYFYLQIYVEKKHFGLNGGLADYFSEQVFFNFMTGQFNINS
jgi:hypothetical protein